MKKKSVIHIEDLTVTQEILLQGSSSIFMCRAD